MRSNCSRKHTCLSGSTERITQRHVRELYTFPCETARITTYLISITTNCKTISCRPVSTNRRPLACRDQRHCSGGGSAAWAQKVLPAYLGLSQTPRDAALSLCHVLIHGVLSLPHFSYLEIWIRPTLWILGYSADLEILRDCLFWWKTRSKGQAGRVSCSSLKCHVL